VKLGVRLPNSRAHATAAHLEQVAQWADDYGYDSVWVSDHVTFPIHMKSGGHYGPYPSDTPWLDPLLSLAWVARTHPRLQVGTSILVAALRHPVLLAKQLSTLDHLTGGRLMIGVGAGWMQEEFEAVGVDFTTRVSRTRESVDVMRLFWRGEPVHHQGKIWQLDGYRMHPPASTGRIPIYWGGNGSQAIRRAAEHGDGWNPADHTAEELEAGVADIRRHCETIGRDPQEVAVIARPGPSRKYELTAESQQWHRELGVELVIVDPPSQDSRLRDFQEEMERVAEFSVQKSA
jgi:probable F420-dependent oxidoreductase